MYKLYANKTNTNLKNCNAIIYHRLHKSQNNNKKNKSIFFNTLYALSNKLEPKTIKQNILKYHEY